MLKLFTTKYRIVTSLENGFEAQLKKWYYPWWVPIDFGNWHRSIHAREIYIKDYRKNQHHKVIKNIDN